MNENMEKFIAALRSDKYSQCYGAMVIRSAGTGQVCYCAIGVGYDVAAENGAITKHDERDLIDFDGHVIAPPVALDDWLGISRQDVSWIIGLNDGERLSFSEIADKLEERFGGKQ